MRMPPLLADFSHARACKPFCEKYLTLPYQTMDLLPFTTLLFASKDTYTCNGQKLLNFKKCCNVFLSLIITGNCKCTVRLNSHYNQGS